MAVKEDRSSTHLPDGPAGNDLGSRGAQRRRLLQLAGGSAVAFAMAPTMDASAAEESADERRKARYRESDDVKAFYRVNRYPKAK